MKKKFKITEEQAQQIIKLSEADMPGGTTTSTTPCDQWLTTYPNGVVGDIDCCKQLAGGTLTSSSKQQCNNTWNPVGSGWQECCAPINDPCEPPPGGCPQGTVWQGAPVCDCVPHLGENPCKDNPNPECYWCQAEQGASCVPVGANLSYAMSNGYNLYQNAADCTLGEPECGGDPHTGGKVDCMCCKDGNAVGMAQQVATAADCATTNFGPQYTDCVEHTTPYVDPCKRGNTHGDRPCADVSCKNPNHVQGPPPDCICDCPPGSGEKGCKKPYGNWNPDECCCADQKGNCDPAFVGPLYTENKTELSEEIKRIKQLLR